MPVPHRDRGAYMVTPRTVLAIELFYPVDTVHIKFGQHGTGKGTPLRYSDVARFLHAYPQKSVFLRRKFGSLEIPVAPGDPNVRPRSQCLLALLHYWVADSRLPGEALSRPPSCM